MTSLILTILLGADVGAARMPAPQTDEPQVVYDSYDPAITEAYRLKRPIAVFVRTPVQTVPGFILAKLDSYAGDATPRVVVGVPTTRTDSLYQRTDLAPWATVQQIVNVRKRDPRSLPVLYQATYQPPVPQLRPYTVCGPNGCQVIWR